MSEKPKHPEDGRDEPGASDAELAFRAMLRSFGHIHRAMTPYFAAHGISGAQWAVMRVLHGAQADGEAALRLTDLGDRLLIKPPSVTGVIDRLQRDGLVGNAPQADDRRVRRVRLTARGSRLVETILRGHPQQLGKILAGLSENEKRTLKALHEKIAAHLDQAGDSHAETTPARKARAPRSRGR